MLNIVKYMKNKIRYQSSSIIRIYTYYLTGASLKCPF